MAPIPISLNGLDITITAHPLTHEAFAPFGAVVQNPRPDVHPSDFAHAGPLPLDAVSANQSTAIKYQHVTRVHNGYGNAPSGVPGVAVMNMFVCAARKLQQQREQSRRPAGASSSADSSMATLSSASGSSFFAVNILERHPYTTQTFTPLSVSGRHARLDSAHQSPQAQTPNNRYLVIVAPNKPSAAAAAAGTATTPTATSSGVSSPPDLSRIKAFVATLDQAVTYGAGTWHAPMVALGPEGTAVDFVVTQFANSVGDEDCQEVTFGSSGDGSVFVDVLPPPPIARAAKL